ncbi:hypothetical protein OEZ71_06885 [Defluviimonas sp. WL0050]|uniref:Uncharacterized protein n=1 Tax=Albidovulum litorale TaxID=2984134 RepID=A0ABT2ZLS6_9RHOB|nr:hypothetical protein [Defluviimonas sp. WL0050]MCV2872017.1 hypothetical protein [Defluviimonas sp. WL0050]
MRTINPGLFARLMQLPEAIRADLLEFLGATSMEDAQLAVVIDDAAARARAVRLSSGRIDDII